MGSQENHVDGEWMREFRISQTSLKVWRDELRDRLKNSDWGLKDIDNRILCETVFFGKNYWEIEGMDPDQVMRIKTDALRYLASTAPVALTKELSDITQLVVPYLGLVAEVNALEGGEYVSVKEANEATGYSTSQISALASSQQISSYRNGKKVFVRLDDLRNYQEQIRSVGAPRHPRKNS